MQSKTSVMLFVSVHLVCILQIHIVETKAVVKPNITDENPMHFGYLDKAKSDNTEEIMLGVAGATVYGDEDKNDVRKTRNALGYINLERRKLPAYTYEGKAEVGFWRFTREENDMFEGNLKVGRKDGNIDAKALTAGVEAGVGVLGFSFMGRASVVDVTMNTGPIGVNLAVSADTGWIVNLEGAEFKYLGIGGKISKNGIQGCFVVCVMINW